MKKIPVANFHIGPDEPLCLISGPCAIESEALALETATILKELCAKHGINFIYKSSYDKANRSSIHSFRGPGIEKGLAILKKVKEEVGVPILSDIHAPNEAAYAAEVCDVIQIPAFLCRQTDLLVAAGKSGAVVNAKKGQFLSPWDVQNIVDKLESVGCEKILLTDRGTTFGYNNLVSDMRAVPVMQATGYPFCFDASHSVMLPGGMGSASGGQREFIPTLSKASIAAGANAIFLESHPNPEEAKSDKMTVFPLKEMDGYLKMISTLYRCVQEL